MDGERGTPAEKGERERGDLEQARASINLNDGGDDDGGGDI
jgi:hypothetical protein